jgi:hypothetical protein
MRKAVDVKSRLSSLKKRLEEVNRAWTLKDYESLLMFYVAIVPRISGGRAM